MENNKVIYTIQKKKMLPTEFVDIYKKAGENEKNFAWKAAAVMYATVRHESFIDAFANMDEYAKAIGVNKSTVSRKIRAVETRLVLFNEYGDKYMHLSLECVIELLPLVKDDNLFDFMDTNDIDDLSNRDRMRELVKIYRDAHKIEIGEESDENAGEESDENSGEEKESINIEKIGWIGFSIRDRNGEELCTLTVEKTREKQILIETLRSFGIVV